jgi:hypothetical protein
MKVIKSKRLKIIILLKLRIFNNKKATLDKQIWEMKLLINLKMMSRKNTQLCKIRIKIIIIFINLKSVLKLSSCWPYINPLWNKIPIIIFNSRISVRRLILFLNRMINRQLKILCREINKMKKKLVSTKN